MPILYIAIDISIKNIFNTDALKRYMWFLLCHYTLYIYLVYTHSVILVISNLIGSLSRTIQQYSPSSEWIMCELGVFPIFLENDLFEVDKIVRQERLGGIQNSVFPFTVAEFCARWIVYNSPLFA